MVQSCHDFVTILKLLSHALLDTQLSIPGATPDVKRLQTTV